MTAGSDRLATTGDDETSDESGDLKRNLRLIPYHQALTRAVVWMPIFVLFTRAEFGLDGALALGSIYYFSVVVLEVPSGWMSDRLGRVATLRMAAVGFVFAQAAFLLAGSSFVLVAVGQALLAVGFASLSGTDITFHFDSLEATGSDDRFASERSQVEAIGYVTAAASALLGGALGLVDLRLAFAAGLAFALVQLALTFVLKEPPRTGRAERPGRQVVNCLSYLSDRRLGWIFFYGVLMVTLEHVAFTNSQPWLTEVLGQDVDDLGITPLVSGVTLAAVAFIGAGAARSSAALAERFGSVNALIGLGVVSAVAVTGMALSFHIAVIGLLLLRSVQGAAAPVIIGAEVAPKVLQEHRATLLSLNSLVGRLSYSLLLAGVGLAVADQVEARAQVTEALLIVSVVSWVMIGALIVSSRLATNRHAAPQT